MKSPPTTVFIRDKGVSYHDWLPTIETAFNKWDSWTILDRFSESDNGHPQPSYVDTDVLRVAWGAPAFEIGMRIAREGATISLIHVMPESVLSQWQETNFNQHHMMFVPSDWMGTRDDEEII